MRKLAAFVALCLVILLAVYSVRRNSEEQVNTHLMEADYPIYSSLSTLMASSTIVIRGTVERDFAAKRIIPSTVKLSELPDWKAKDIGFLMTTIQVHVTDVIKGEPLLLNNSVLVNQGGGVGGGHTYILKDQPLAKKGNDLLLFLRLLDDGSYAVVGGPQGRFTIDRETLSSASNSEDVANLPIVKSIRQSTWDSTKEELLKNVS